MAETESSASSEMPRYECHKIVHALKIGVLHHGSLGVVMHPVGAGYKPINLTPEYMAKHDPQVDGYYVVYADGYESFSPAKAFEEGYTRIE